MSDINVRRNLKYDFTHDELLSMGSELASNEQELRSLEDQKKSVNAEFTSRMTVTKERINMLTNKIAARFEFVDVDCQVFYHTPDKNIKTLVRKDNGDSFTEPMTAADYDLFNQYEEEANANQDADAEGVPDVANDELPFGANEIKVTATMNDGSETDITDKVVEEFKKGKTKATQEVAETSEV